MGNTEKKPAKFVAVIFPNDTILGFSDFFVWTNHANKTWIEKVLEK